MSFFWQQWALYIGGDVSVVFGLLKVMRIQFWPIKVIYGHWWFHKEPLIFMKPLHYTKVSQGFKWGYINVIEEPFWFSKELFSEQFIKETSFFPNFWRMFFFFKYPFPLSICSHYIYTFLIWKDSMNVQSSSWSHWFQHCKKKNIAAISYRNLK